MIQSSRLDMGMAPHGMQNDISDEVDPLIMNVATLIVITITQIQRARGSGINRGTSQSM